MNRGRAGSGFTPAEQTVPPDAAPSTLGPGSPPRIGSGAAAGMRDEGATTLTPSSRSGAHERDKFR